MKKNSRTNNELHVFMNGEMTNHLNLKHVYNVQAFPLYE